MDALETSDGSLVRRPNRGFWVVALCLLAAGTVVVTGALVTRPDPRGADARTNLRAALTAARIVREEAGTYAAASPEELEVVDVTLTFVSGQRASTGPRRISVHAVGNVVAMAALDPSGTCYWIRESADAADSTGASSRYGAGEPCTGEAAIGADDASW